MELRGLILDKNDEITEIITTRPEYGNLSKWLRDFRVEEPERSRDKDGGFIASLKKALDKLNSELGFVFDPHYEPGLVFPRYSILIDVIKLINNSLDYKVYKEDDFLGWVYQYFDEEGKQAIYNRLNISARNKLEDYDIIPYTQLYTDHYIVEFITQNALGTWWRAQHPESKALEQWEYLLPGSIVENESEELELKDIKILDPACGSGHFLLYAFNLLFELYLEEGKIPQNDIPRFILENNLYSVDIDRRAVQLASLSLYLKAKEINPSLTISGLNLYSTDIIFQNIELFEDLKKRIKGRSEEEKELVESIWQGMRKISSLGSLLPIEREIEHFIRSRKAGITQFIDGYDTRWEQWKDTLISIFKDIINDALKNQDPNEILFARDGMRSVNFLDVFRNRYDFILMNPPYINSRRMNSNYKQALKNYYGPNYFDTSASFIQRAFELLKKNGILGAIFPSTIGFLKNFRTVRDQVLDNNFLKIYVSLGSNCFSEISGERFKASIMVIKKNSIGITKYVNVANFTDPESKSIALIKKDQVTEVNPEIFKKIERVPFLFDLPQEILRFFEKYPPLLDIATPRKGLDTGNNDRFFRFKWEIDPSKIGIRWYPLNKGGGKIRWYGYQKTFINWESNGKELKDFPGSNIRNENFYFKEAITYSTLGYYFCARYLPPGYIFETNGSCIFSKENLFFLLAYLNSTLGEFILQQLNPSIVTNISDLYRLPIYIPDENNRNTLSKMSKKCVALQKWAYQFVATDQEFKHTAIYLTLKRKNSENLLDIITFFYDKIELNLLQVYLYEALIDKKIFEIYGVSSKTQSLIFNLSEPRIGRFPLIKGKISINYSLKQNLREYIEELSSISINSSDLEEIVKNLKSGKPLEDISQEFMINPLSIAIIRRENNIIPKKSIQVLVEDFLTELILKVLKGDKDGIIPLSKNTGYRSLESIILQNLELLVGETRFNDFKKDLQAIIGKSISKWFDNDFFKRHIVQFERRPPIWHISSPAHNFGCFLYYLKLTEDTVSKIKFNYLRPEIEYHKRLIKALQDSLNTQEGDLDKTTKKELEKLENILEDLKKFEGTLEKLISMNYNPDIDDGIKVNLRPWQDLQLLAINKVITYKKAK